MQRTIMMLLMRNARLLWPLLQKGGVALMGLIGVAAARAGRTKSGGAVHEITAGPETPMGSPQANEALRQMLRAHGDDGRNPRHILHYAYPSKHRAARQPEVVMSYLTAYDVVVRDAEQDNGLVIEHTRDVLAETFDPFTSKLRSDLATLGWEYDGWECAVEQTGQS